MEKSYLLETLEIIYSRLKLECSILVNGDANGWRGRESYLTTKSLSVAVLRMEID